MAENRLRRQWLATPADVISFDTTSLPLRYHFVTTSLPASLPVRYRLAGPAVDSSHLSTGRRQPHRRLRRATPATATRRRPRPGGQPDGRTDGRSSSGAAKEGGQGEQLRTHISDEKCLAFRQRNMQTGRYRVIR